MICVMNFELFTSDEHTHRSFLFKDTQTSIMEEQSKMDFKCRCGSNKNYLDCCGAYINNNRLPNTPEQLMRSRYTAYATYNIEYIANTMLGKALNGFDLKGALIWAKTIIWEKLEIINTSLENNNLGFVEFKAHYTEQNQHGILHEKSTFHRIKGKWFYVDGVIL